MASPIMDTAILTKPVNVIFQRLFLERAKPLCPYFAGTKPGSVVQHGGSFTATWRRVENLTPTTTALAELATNVAYPTRDGATLSITDVSVAVSKYGDHVVLNEEADLVNFNGQTDEILAVLAIQAGRSLNMLQRNEVEDNSTLEYAGGAASDGAVVSKITAAALDAAIVDLSTNDAMTFTPMSTGTDVVGSSPVLPSYWAACHPHVAYDIESLTGFKSVETYGSHTQTAPGEFGLYAGAGVGVRFIQTSDASIDAGAGGATTSTGMRGATNINLYTTAIWGKSAIGSLGFGFEHIQETYRSGDKLPAVQIINKPRGSAGAADPFDELGTMAWKSWHAAKILNGNWTRGIRSAATDL